MSDSIEKKLRNLNKKLKDIDNLASKPAASLNHEEREKLNRKAALEEERALLMSQLDHHNDEVKPTPAATTVVEHVVQSQGRPDPVTKPVESRPINAHFDHQPRGAVTAPVADKQKVLKVKMPAASTSKQKVVVAATAAAISNLTHIQQFYRSKPLFAVATLPAHESVVTCVDINDRWIVSGSEDTSVQLWSLTDLKLLKHFGGHSAAVHSVRICHRNATSEVICSVAADSFLFVWCPHTGEKLQSVYIYSPVLCMDVLRFKSRDSSLVVTGTRNAELLVWRVSNGEKVSALANVCEDCVVCVSCSEDGKRMVSGSSAGYLTVWQIEFEPAHDKIIFTALFQSSSWPSLNEHMGGVTCALLTSSGEHVLWGDRDGWNIKKATMQAASGGVILGKIANRATSSCRGTWALASFNDGELVISSSYSQSDHEGYLTVRAGAEDKYLCTFNDGVHGVVKCCKFAGDGRLFVTGGSHLKLWRPQNETVKRSNELTAMVTPTDFERLADASAMENSDFEYELEPDDDDDTEDIYQDRDTHTVHAAQKQKKVAQILQQSPVSTITWLKSWCTIL